MNAAAGSPGQDNYTYVSPIEDIGQDEFVRICRYAFDRIGVKIGENKQSMVISRLARRLSHHGIRSYSDYIEKVASGALPGEEQVMLDLLTTNETYMWREPAHFFFFRDEILRPWRAGVPFRAWSAACSSGEEAYCLAMLAHEQLGDGPWEIVGTDVSSRVLQTARAARYQMQRIDTVPVNYLHEYCLKGVGNQAGWMLMDKRLRQRVSFSLMNLVGAIPPEIGMFDVIFLRNTLIYFDEPTRKSIVSRLLRQLKPAGYFFVSHTETIAGLSDELQLVKPSVYRKLLP